MNANYSGILPDKGFKYFFKSLLSFGQSTKNSVNIE